MIVLISVIWYTITWHEKLPIGTEHQRIGITPLTTSGDDDSV